MLKCCCCCCRREPEHTYIYLYTPSMSTDSSSSSSSSFSLFRCLVCTLFIFCLIIVLILTGIIIYRFNNDSISLKANMDQRVIPVAKRRQLPDFVNTKIDPCENFYNFVCDKWIHKKSSEIYDEAEEEENERKWMRIRHRIHDILMVNISNNPSISSESNISSSSLSVYKLYQLCETQSITLLLDEFEHHINSLIQQEPYRSYLTLYNQTNLTSLPLILEYNPFFQIVHSPSDNYSFSTIIRTYPRSLPSPLMIFPNLTILNQTALKNLIKFNNDYTKFLQKANDLVKLYEQEYNQDALIVKRIFSFSDYDLCLPSLNKSNNGLQNLIELLNYFLQNRLSQFNTKLMDKQIRILENITDNHTLVEQLKRIQFEFQIIQQIIPLVKNQSIEKNTSCIINLLNELLDKRIRLHELPLSINLYRENVTEEYFISKDWPYLMMLYDHLLKNLSTDTLINFVFYNYYGQLIYPYYQPHIARSDDIKSFNLSCHVRTCFDIFNCYHPSLLNQILDERNEIPVHALETTVQNLINRFRSLIEQSDNLFLNEKNLLLNELNQLKFFIGHYPTPVSIPLLPNLNSSSYLDYVKLFSSTSNNHQSQNFYSIEPIYSLLNHTLLLPYGFLYLSNNSIEYSLIKFFLKIFAKIIHTDPFYIECLIKSFDDLTNTTIINTNDEHITYLLYRSKFLSQHNINLDEYLWPFMSANLLMKQFLINYTVENYCQNSNTYQIYANNSYLIDDVYLIFHCPQASSIIQSKCTVN